jgi:hypothetical protein
LSSIPLFFFFFKITVVDNFQEAVPVVWMMASSNKTDLLKKGLEELKKPIQDEKWKPYVMLDKDWTEIKATSEVGMIPILCRFHIHQTLQKKFEKDYDIVLKHFDSVQNAREKEVATKVTEALEEIKKKCFRRSKEKYFRKNWFCDDILPMILNIGRMHNYGGWNTNNYAEVIFKNLVYFFLNGKGNLRISSLLQVIIERVNPSFHIKNLSKRKGTFIAKNTQLGEKI